MDRRRDTEQPDIRFEFQWLPPERGGHHGPPWEGMRPHIRFPDAPQATADSARSLTCLRVEFDAALARGRAAGLFTSSPSELGGVLRPGVRFELLDGVRVLATCRITHVATER